MAFIINPGTEKQTNTTEANALKLAEYICEDIEISNDSFKRNPKTDSDGWYGFTFKGERGEVEVDIPGVDPDTTRLGIPFQSLRLYVNGSSWLYGYALGFILDGIQKDD